MNVMFLDLEMNNPTENKEIIQIGTCIGNVNTGEVLSKKSYMIKTIEPLTEYITKLTNITQEMVNNGITFSLLLNS